MGPSTHHQPGKSRVKHLECHSKVAHREPRYLQIISLQTLHYLLLSLVIPPLVTLLTDGNALTYAGGPYNKGYVLDWREIASRTTAKKLPRQPPAVEKRHFVLSGAQASGRTLEGAHGQLSSHDLENASVESFVQRSLSRRDYERTHYAVKDEKDDDFEVWDYGVSRRRGWVLAGTWLIACMVE
jgi:hypothetical protein